MTYRSESRGLMYTAPPSGEDDETKRPTAEATDRTEAETAAPATTDETDRTAADDDRDAERAMPSLGETSATTDANWTGTVSADSTVPADD